MAGSCTVCFLDGSGEGKSKSSSPKRLKPVEHEENREVENMRSNSEVKPSKKSVEEKIYNQLIGAMKLQAVVTEKACRLSAFRF